MNYKQYGLIILVCTQLSGCVSTLWTGAGLIYDRHTIYKKLSDYQLSASVNQALYHDKSFKVQGCSIDVAVFNGDVLLAGHVPTQALLKEAQLRIEQKANYRRLFNQLTVSSEPDNTLSDIWISTKIKSKIIAEDEVNPREFKIVTSNSVVYIMGDVKPKQAKKVIKIAKQTTGVKRIVKILKYYHYHNKVVA